MPFFSIIISLNLERSLGEYRSCRGMIVAGRAEICSCSSSKKASDASSGLPPFVIVGNSHPLSRAATTYFKSTIASCRHL